LQHYHSTAVDDLDRTSLTPSSHLQTNSQNHDNLYTSRYIL